MSFPSLIPYGWSDRWSALFADVATPGAVPARVLRHDSVSVAAAGPEGTITAVLSSPVGSIAVGDWVGVTDEVVTSLLPRTSLLRRRAALADEEQPLAANVDLVLLVCGLDRPLKAGRIHRASALAWDAGARPLLVLSKADLAPTTDVSRVEAENPGLDVVMVSSRHGDGLERLREATKDLTVVLLGESGAGKSTLVNALVGNDVSATGAVREGDSKGRHTTTARELHLVPSGGVLIDTPGLRAVGLWVDPDSINATFADVLETSEQCRFRDCRHDGEPGCAVADAVANGTVPNERFQAFLALRREAESAELRANEAARRRQDRKFGRVAKDAQKRKGRQ